MFNNLSTDIKISNFFSMMICIILLIVPVLAFGQDGTAWKQKIESAKAGQIITLPAGELAIGDVTIPTGVKVCGAGNDKTIINAAAYKTGFIIRGNKGVELSDLSVRNARETGILVSKASKVTISRLKVIGNLTGLLLDNVVQGKVENLVVAKNRTGASMAGNSKTSMANCSFVDNYSIALTVAHANSVAVFNNLFVNSPTAVYLTRDNKNLAMDYNFFLASFIGKFESEATRTTLAGWQRISKQDAHSLSMSIEFADAINDNYRTVSKLFWAPTLATTSDWGVGKLLGYSAPKNDIDGNKRNGSVDLGAYEISFVTDRKPDGYFNITSADGVKSAGLYNADGVNVAIFFQNKPLSKGKHPFWLPGRDNQNRPLLVGKYEVRVVESQLSNAYLGLAGNFGKSSDRLDGCSWAEEMFAFDTKDRLYIAQNSFENGMGVRAFDPSYTTPRWMMPGGGGTVGVATDATDIYYLQKNAGSYNLRKINMETGVMGQIAVGAPNRVFKDIFSSKVYGMALLKGKLYIADAGKGKIFTSPASDPTFTTSFDVPGASSVTADVKANLLWVISADGKLLALDPATGAIKATSDVVKGAKDISANNNRLAVLSPVTGKIFIFDSSDPANLRQLNTIGTGDGPYGPQMPNRFWFQSSEATKTHVAINCKGEIAVVDSLRVSFWAADGKLKKQGIGFWGQHNYLGKFAGDTDVRIWGISGDYSIKMDSQNKRWSPDTKWQMPDYTFNGRSPRNYFTTGGKNFGVYEILVGDPGKTADGKVMVSGYDKTNQELAYLVVRLDEKIAVPVSIYCYDSAKKTLVEIHDDNKDGIIDAKDTAKEIRQADGSSVNIPWDRYGGLPRANGDMVFTNSGPNMIGRLIKMTGLDAGGNYPVYAWDKQQPIPCTFDGKTAGFISPYNFKTMEQVNSAVQIAEMSDGGYASSMALRSSGGTGLANGAGTDIGGFSKDGRLRWIFKLNTVQGSEGVQSIPEYKMVMGMTSTQCDYMVMDEDGLGLGVLAMPKEAYWMGMWSDHAQQQQTYVGNDGKPYYILGDYSVNGFHWFEITGTQKTKKQTIPVQIDIPVTAVLATLPGRVQEKLPVPPTTKVTVRRLEKPLAIDGDMKKWRDAGIAPAALVTPETGTADIIGPQDCSAIIRLAYQGTDLYVQTIVFDNVVTFHQPLGQMYQQDGIEMGVNSFMEGFKFNVANTTDHGTTVFRNKFVIASMDRIYTNEQVPRNIKILDNAKDVEERQFIEAIYGVDLSKSKVIVTEFKLPLTAAVGLDGDPKMVTVAPGKTFWTGFFINDNDMPGGDVQKYLAWPATYGTFAVKEAGALATFE
jgi:hypothetical protein